MDSETHDPIDVIQKQLRYSNMKSFIMYASFLKEVTKRIKEDEKG